MGYEKYRVYQRGNGGMTEIDRENIDGGSNENKKITRHFKGGNLSGNNHNRKENKEL
jgi:hypothetical protein